MFSSKHTLLKHAESEGWTQDTMFFICCQYIDQCCTDDFDEFVRGYVSGGKPDVWVVVIDETDNWDNDIIAKTGRILGVYLYDRHAPIHVCELTPSYELYFVDYTTENIVSDGDRAGDWKLWDTIHGTGNPGAVYVHTYQIDQARMMREQDDPEFPGFLQPGENIGQFQYVSPDEWDAGEPAPGDDYMQDLVDEFHANPVY